MKNTFKTISAFALVATLSLVAFAAVNFDAATGTGFVGKGDVQLALNYNNKQLQDNANSLVFSVETVSEVSWVCTNVNHQNQQMQERERTTTTQGVLSSVAREKNQITGFFLTGYGSSSTTSTEGPALNSCPTNWALTTPAGDPEVVGGSGLKVNGVNLQ